MCGKRFIAYLMQFSGSFLQSTLHLNLCQVSHPMGGVRARPLSRALAVAKKMRPMMTRFVRFIFASDVDTNVN